MTDIVYHLEPNQGPFASNLSYDPNRMMALGLGPYDLSHVSDDTAIAPVGSGTVLTPQGPVNDLMSLRQKYPFMQIMPLPPMSAAACLVTPRTINGFTYYTGDLLIPDGAVLCRFLANDEVYCSRHGTAEVPNTDNTASANGAYRCESFMVANADGICYYVGGIKSLSFACVNNTAIVSGMFYAPDQYPR